MHGKQFPRWIKPRGQQTQYPSSPTHKKKVILTNFGDKFDIQMTFIHKRLQIQKN